VAVRILIDEQTFELPAGTDVKALRWHVAAVVTRSVVEPLVLADGTSVLVNWRAVRLVEILAS
jgi:hypothetical protein